MRPVGAAEFSGAGPAVAQGPLAAYCAERKEIEMLSKEVQRSQQFRPQAATWAAAVEEWDFAQD